MAVIEDSFTSEERQWVESIGGYNERPDSSKSMQIYFDNDWSYYVGVYKIASSLFECQVYGDRECDDYDSVFGNSIQEAIVKALLVCRKTLVERIEKMDGKEDGK